MCVCVCVWYTWRAALLALLTLALTHVRITALLR